MNYLICFETKVGTFGGVLTMLLFSVQPGQLLTTAVVAATGTLVSFLVSVFCKWVFEKMKSG